jgi:hypothetical protein
MPIAHLLNSRESATAAGLQFILAEFCAKQGGGNSEFEAVRIENTLAGEL